MIENCEYNCYNGEECYTFRIHEKRCAEVKKEEQLKLEKELREKIPKELLEKSINQYKTYSDIAYKLNTDVETIKKCCELYNLETLIARNYKERKEIPDDYKEIDTDPIKRAKKMQECLEISKKPVPNYKENAKGIYGIIRKDTGEKIYIGSTENLGERIRRHYEVSNTESAQWVHRYIKENGGWPEYSIKLLEERASHLGLNYIENLWCEALQPIGNRISPLKK
jgi:hypothetical protein